MNRTILIIILALLVLFLIWYALKSNVSNMTLPCPMRLYSPYCSPCDIPKYLHETETTNVIWSYWHDEKVPKSVSLAYQTWLYYQPHFIICLLSEKTLNLFLPENLPQADSHQERADLLRLALLEKYGGYWLDSTIFLQKPLDKLWEPKNYDVGGYWIDDFTTDLQHKVFENWFIVAPRQSPLIRAWKEEFFRAVSYKNREKYITELRKSGVDLQDIAGTEYLMMHCCYLKITRGEHPYRTRLISVHDPQEGPFYYLTKGNKNAFNSVSGILSLLWQNDEKICQSVLKLRGPERTILDIFWFLCQYNSLLGRKQARVIFKKF